MAERDERLLEFVGELRNQFMLLIEENAHQLVDATAWNQRLRTLDKLWRKVHAAPKEGL